MSEERQSNFLVRTYRRYIGPGTPGEAIGYWVFIIGAILGVIGIVVFLYSTTIDLNGGEPFDEREIAVVLSSIGLMMLLLGVVIRLPSNRRVTLVALLGAVITLAATVAFIWAYPSNWNVPTDDFSSEIIAIYSVGIGLIVLSAIILPALLKTPEDVFEDLAPAKVDSKGTFELFRDRADDWRWRLRHSNGNIIASSGEGYSSKQNARKGMESVRKNVPGAPVIEVNRPEDASQATFQLYEDQAGEWRWRLRHDNGRIIADSGEGYNERSGASDAIARVREYAASAHLLQLENGAFDLYSRDGQWHWRLLNPRGRALAESPHGYDSRADAVTAVEELRLAESVTAEVTPSGDGYTWQLVRDGAPLAAGTRTYSNERNANDAISRAQALVEGADILTLNVGAFDLYKDKADEWRWRLLASNGRIIADSGEGYSARAKARQGVTSVQRNAPDAPVQS